MQTLVSSQDINVTVLHNLEISFSRMINLAVGISVFVSVRTNFMITSSMHELTTRPSQRFSILRLL
jgi:hypothetical protein